MFSGDSNLMGYHSSQEWEMVDQLFAECPSYHSTTYHNTSSSTSCLDKEEEEHSGRFAHLRLGDCCEFTPSMQLMDCEMDTSCLFDVEDRHPHFTELEVVDDSPMMDEDQDCEWPLEEDTPFSEESRQAILLFFKAFDVDGDNFLSPTEVLAFFQHLNPDLQDGPEFRNSFERIDLDRDGKISLEEFLVFADQLFSTEDLNNVLQVHAVFQLYDHSHSGRISREDVARTYLQRESKQATQDMLNSFFELVDTDEDGIICWSEFLMSAIMNFDFFEEYYCNEFHQHRQQL